MSTKLPTSMRALAIRDGGLVPVSLALPKPKQDEVLIRVAYAGINRADALQMRGKYAAPTGAPEEPGLEVSGIIVAVGEGVSGFIPGQKVCALLSGGGYAEYVVAQATQAIDLPQGIDLKAAASLPEAAATSIMALLLEGNLKPGERVLIHGGASGVGVLMTQIARSLGAEVFATVGCGEKQNLLHSFNILTINHCTAPFAAQLMEMTRHEGVDIIIDTLGGPQLETHLRLLRKGGRLVSLAMLEGSEVPAGFKMTRILMNHLRIGGATLRSRTPAEKAEMMRLVATHVWPKLADGSIKPVIDSVFPLERAEKALERMEERLHMGKILLEVTPG